MRLTTSPPSCAECHEIWEPKPSGTLWATPGLLRDCFTFTFYVCVISETWVLKETAIQKLLVFERKILRRIFGPTKENQLWRIKTNEELDKLIKHKNIVNCVKAQRLSRFGHVQRMADTRTVKKIFKWKSLTKRSQGRPKYRWEDNIKQDICQMKVKNWIACVQDRGKWKEVVEKVKTFNH